MLGWEYFIKWAKQKQKIVSIKKNVSKTNLVSAIDHENWFMSIISTIILGSGLPGWK